jgi:hypothetical protein
MSTACDASSVAGAAGGARDLALPQHSEHLTHTHLDPRGMGRHAGQDLALLTHYYNAAQI